jgi:hypothetical protein
MQVYNIVGGDLLHIERKDNKYVLAYEYHGNKLLIRNNNILTFDKYTDAKDMLVELVKTQVFRKYFDLYPTKKIILPVRIEKGRTRVNTEFNKELMKDFLKTNEGRKAKITIEILEGGKNGETN